MEIFLSKDGTQSDLFPIDQVKQLISDGVYSSSDLAWHDRSGQWVKISEHPDLTPGVPTPKRKWYDSKNSPYSMDFLSNPHLGSIKSQKQAITVITVTAWMYYLIASINVLIAIAFPPSLLMAVGIAFLAFRLQRYKSRRAAKILLVIAIVSILLNIATIFASFLLLPLTIFQLVLTARSIEACGKFQTLQVGEKIVV